MPSPEDVILKEIDKFMDQVQDRIFQLSQENIIDKKKIDTGTLLKTANINRRFLEKEIVYPAPYADLVEFGRNPGQMPPPDSLFKWVRRKLGITNDNEAKRVSWAIAKSIEKRGIDPSPYMEPAISQAKMEFGL